MTDAALFTPPLVPPATEILPVLEVARRARRNPLEIVPDLAYRQPMVSGRTVLRWHMVMDPGALRRVMLENVANYPKSEVTLRLLRPAVGQSLFTAEGAHWRWQRRATAPAFQHRRIMALSPMMTEAAEAASRRFDAAQGAPLDMSAQMTEVTFDVVCDALLSGRDAIDREALIGALIRYIDTVGRVSLLDVLGIPRWVPRPALFRSIGAIREARRIMDAAIARRRAGAPQDDLLDRILDAQDPETGRRMTDEEARDNLLTFVVAGHETTALTLAWALYLIASHPPTQERLAQETRAVLADGRAATGEDAERLPFTRQVIEETLRLYPPAAMLSRTAQAPDTLGGREIRRGDTVILPIYTLHRNALLWERPHAFDPDRFAPEAAKARDRFAYLPFGGGPRICIGMNFALIEAAIVLATLVSRFRFTVPEDFTARPVMTLTLRPATGLPLHVARRN